MLIKIVHLEVTGPAELTIGFSDGTSADWNGAAILARDTVMTRPLADPTYFARAFIEAGALAWPNGLEFSPVTLHEKLKASGALVKRAA